MKIVIIGVKGQLGTDCSLLLGKEHEVTGIDYPAIDITKPESVQSCLEQIRPQAIINCAAYTAVDACESNREICWQVNAEGPRHLARAASKYGAKLIHISTDYVFDGRKPAPQAYLENDPTNPLSEYGRSKLAGEQAVQETSTNHLILRTAWLYSAHGPNFLKTMLRLAVTAPDREIKVVDDQYGSLTWSLTLARQIETLLDTELQGIVHATAENYSTWYQAAKAFLEAMAVPFRMRPCSTAEYPTPAHRPANSILDNQVLKQAGKNCFAPWQDDMHRFVLANREKLLAELMNTKK